MNLPASSFSLQTSLIDPRCPWVQVHAALETPSWRLVDFKFDNAEEAGNDHTIYVYLTDADGKPARGVTVRHGWPTIEKPDETIQGKTNALGEINWAMWDDSIINEQHPRGPYWIQPRPVGDIVDGMGLPALRHVNYRLFYRWVAAAEPPPPEPPPPPHEEEPDFWIKARATSKELPAAQFILMPYAGLNYRVTRTGDGGIIAVGVESPGAIFLMTAAEVLKEV